VKLDRFAKTTTKDAVDRALILKRFKEMGLSPYESKSYLSLLEKDTLTVTEVAKIAGIPRTNAYEALEKLLAKGLCLARPGNTKKYSASDPISLKDKFLARADHAMEVEMANLSKKEKEFREKHETEKKAKLLDLSNKEKKISEENKTAKENINQIIEELKPQYKNSRANENPLDYIEIIKDPYQIHKRFMELFGETKKEVLAFTKPPYSAPRQKLEEQVDLETDLLKRQIQARSIYEIAIDKDEKKWQLEMVNRAVRAGEGARVITELPMKMAIFDEKIVILPLEDPISTGKSFTAQIVKHPALAKSLKMLFNHVWEQAEDYHVLEDLLKKM
jgi:sugar-specific transcriptional regulator TrmB